MRIEVQEQGAFHSARVELAPGETFLSEAGAMFHATPNVDVDVTTRSKGGGGLFAGLKRMLTGDSFFLARYELEYGTRGEVGIAPTLAGHIRRIDVTPHASWLCTGGSFLGVEGSLALDSRFQGLRGALSGEGLFYLSVSGTGALLVNAFGRIEELQLDGEIVIDSGHVVAFEEQLRWQIGKAGGSWLTSFLAGEAFVMRFAGQGRILLQSHNPSGFGRRLGRLLPPRQE